MSEFVTVSRELLERCIKANDEPQPSQLYAELRAVLAQEAGHAEEPLGMVEAVAIISFPRELSDELAELLAEKARVCGGGAYDIWEEICEQFGSPPAPVAVILPTLISSEDGPHYSDNRASELGYLSGYNACLDKVKELNQ